MRFPQWVETQPRGTLKRIERERDVGYNTLSRLVRGETIDSYKIAKKVSLATDGAVSIPELCEPPELEAKRKPKSAA